VAAMVAMRTAEALSKCCRACGEAPRATIKYIALLFKSYMFSANGLSRRVQ